MEGNSIKIGIIDDHTLFRDGLASLLEEYKNVEIIFKANGGLEMQKEFNKVEVPDIVLMDINMPGMNGHDATAWIKTNHPEVHVLALSMYEDEMNIIKMLKKGAGGYVLKECNAAELMRAIMSILIHGYYINEVVSGKLMHSIKENLGNSADQKLTERETEFLNLCCSELTYKEIADRFKLSPKTIDGYRDALFQKLNIKSRTGLAIYAIKNGIYAL